MSKIIAEVLSANAGYVAELGDKGDLPLPSGKKSAILTCMDAYPDPAKFAGLAEGNAHFFRNAGGMATGDAIRSLGTSYKLPGTKECFVIHHTDCGMEKFNNETIGDLLEKSLEPSTPNASGWHDSGIGPGTTDGKFIQWLPISDPTQSIIDDVKRIRNSPIVPAEIPIYGYPNDCRMGRLLEVPEAIKAGKTRGGYLND